MNEYSSHVKYENGKAEVQFGSRSFTVARRDAAGSYLCCPIELRTGQLNNTHDFCGRRSQENPG
jgi:hypothetical protein